MASIAAQSSACAVRAQASASVTVSASNARMVSTPARKSFKGVALAKGSFQNQKLSMSRRTNMPVLMSSAETSVDTSVGTTYEVEFPKPVKAKFARGNDGGAYVIQVPNDPLYAELEVGDKIVQISASFGPEMWAAENYGQVMYAMKTRNGNIDMVLEKRGGDLTIFEMEKNDAFKNERAGGNYGYGTKEVQEKNYQTKKEREAARKAMFGEALELFKAEKYDESLVIFENVVGLEPAKYMGDNFSKVTDILKVAQYNVACCYSKINEIDAGLEALEASLKAGFDDFKFVRTDPNLANLRKDEGFSPLMDKFDEPFLNENAMKVLKGLFGRK